MLNTTQPMPRFDRINPAAYAKRLFNAKHAVAIPMPPLARAIYNTSQVHQQIPMPLLDVLFTFNIMLAMVVILIERLSALAPKLPATLDKALPHSQLLDSLNQARQGGKVALDSFPVDRSCSPSSR